MDCLRCTAAEESSLGELTPPGADELLSGIAVSPSRPLLHQ